MSFSNKSQYKACIFDLGGVILGSPLEGIAIYEKNNQIPPDFVNVCIVTKGSDSAFSKLERGTLKLNEFYSQFHEQLADPAQVESYKKFLKIKGRKIPPNLPESIKIDTKAMFELMMEKARMVNRDMLHALVVLRGCGYKVAALTNNWQMDGEGDSKGKNDSSSTTLLNPFFDLIIESSIVGLRKPDPKIYKLVCEKLDIHFTEGVFLDDIGLNVKAAKKLGMATIKVDIGQGRQALDQLKQILNQPNLRLYPDEMVNSVPTTLKYNCGKNNGEIVVDVFGAMDNPRIVFFHGGGQTRHSWSATAARFSSQGYCAMTVDLKGHGESYWDNSSEDAYSMESFGYDIDRLLDKLHMSINHQIHIKPVLVGASLGGISIIHSKLAKSSARAIVLVDIASRMESQGVDRITSWMKTTAEKGFGSLEEAAEAVKEYNPRSSSRIEDNKGGNVITESLKKNLRLKEDGRYYWHWDPKFISPVFAQKDEPDFDLIERNTNELAKDIKCPCLLVRGKNTDVLSLEGVESFRKVVPQTEYVDVAQAGHMVAGDQNTVFAETVLDFVRRIMDSGPVESSKL